MKGVTLTTSRERVEPAAAEQWGDRLGIRPIPVSAQPPGRLIAIEGIDGSGKSTLALNLHGLLCTDHGGGLHNVILTREPYDPAPPGRDRGRIRSALQADSKVDPFQLAIMFAADRFAHLEDIVLPALRRGQDVVCDRYTLSTIAYQSLKLPEDFVFQLVRAAPKPDITVLLDMDPELSMKRLEARGLPLESYEKQATQVELRDRYLDYVSRAAYCGDGHVVIVPAKRTASLTPTALAAYVHNRIARISEFNPTAPALGESRNLRAALVAQWAETVADCLETADAIEEATRIQFGAPGE